MSSYWTNARRRKISRRTMLGASAKAGVGAAGLAMVGCGGDDDDDDAAPAAAEAQAEAQAEEQAMDEDEQAQAEEQAMDEDEEEQAAAAAGGPVRGGQIGLTWSESIYGGFNPYISLSGADHLGYLIYLYDSVLGFDKAGRIEPELAESWELPDDVTYIFNMRPGALFQDGAPCDAHALQANMEYLRNTEDLAGQARAQAGISKSISREVVDDQSWRMVNSEPFAPTLVNFLASPGTGMLISPEHFETTITDPVGAGPMFQTEYNEGENWVTERWDGYWDNDNVWVDGLEKLIIPDANSQWNAFLSGEVSWSGPPGGMTKAVQDQLIADGFQALTGTAQTWQQTWFNLNPDRPPEVNLFRDPRLRRAAHLSIDRAAINAIATENLGKASRAPVSQESWALLPDKDYYADSPNLDEAHQLMEAAGYGDGITGTYLSFATEFHRRMAEPVHNQLREAGFDFQFVENSEAVIIDRLLATDDWQMAVLTWESPFDPDPVLRNSIEGLMNWEYGSPADGPRTGRADPALHPNDEVLQALAETDKLVNASAIGPSQEDRIPHYDALFQDWTDNGWNYHIAQYNQGWAAQGNLGGFEYRDVDGWIVGDGVKYLWFET